MTHYKKKNLLTLAVYLIFLSVGCLCTKHNQVLYLANLLSMLILTHGITEFKNRFFEQKQHGTTHSEKTCWWKYIFNYSLPLSYAALIIALFIILMTWFYNVKSPFKVVLDGNEFLFVIAFAISLSKNIDMDESTVNVKGIDYGSGMAHSYFYGYLKIVLPHLGWRYDKGIKDCMQDYEAKHNIKFGMYKLFILLPSSLHCPNSLASGDSTSVEDGSSLESLKIDRAGVKNRSYKISVYKIRTAAKKVYVAAEYATPIKTLREVTKTNSLYAELYRTHLMNLVLNFYHTLQNLLENEPECREVCEVIYYDDKNKRGKFYDVGKIILARIEELNKRS